jgi:hypothetical protein
MSNEQFAAAVEQAAYKFFKVHYGSDRLSSCAANRALLERYIDDNILDASQAESWEIAYLAVGSQLARTEKPELPTKPVPPSRPVPAEEVLDEQAQLRKVLAEHRGDPKAVANAMRARLRTAEAHARTRIVLPAEYTRARLLKMSGTEMRVLQRRYGFAAMNDRLNSTESN